MGGRTSEQGYGGNTDGNRKRWAQLERDDETGLDYAQARYYSNRWGWFTSPDEFFNDTSPVSPQKWNLYAYVNNNPLNAVDPTGMRTDFIDREGNRTRIDGGRDLLRKEQVKRLDGKDGTGQAKFVASLFGVAA